MSQHGLASSISGVRLHNLRLFSVDKIAALRSNSGLSKSKEEKSESKRSNSIGGKVTINVVAHGTGFVTRQCPTSGKKHRIPTRLLAMACSNNHIIIRFIEQGQRPIVRAIPWFTNHTKRIVSMNFNPTCEWLLCTGNNASLFLVPIEAAVLGHGALSHRQDNYMMANAMLEFQMSKRNRHHTGGLAAHMLSIPGSQDETHTHTGSSPMSRRGSRIGLGSSLSRRNSHEGRSYLDLEDPRSLPTLDERGIISRPVDSSSSRRTVKPLTLPLVGKPPKDYIPSLLNMERARRLTIDRDGQKSQMVSDTSKGGSNQTSNHPGSSSLSSSSSSSPSSSSTSASIDASSSSQSTSESDHVTRTSDIDPFTGIGRKDNHIADKYAGLDFKAKMTSAHETSSAPPLFGSLTDITELVAPTNPKRNAHPTVSACLWWRAFDGTDYAIVATLDGGLTFVNLVTHKRTSYKMKVAVLKLELLTYKGNKSSPSETDNASDTGRSDLRRSTSSPPTDRLSSDSKNWQSINRKSRKGGTLDRLRSSFNRNASSNDSEASRSSNTLTSSSSGKARQWTMVLIYLLDGSIYTMLLEQVLSVPSVASGAKSTSSNSSEGQSNASMDDKEHSRNNSDSSLGTRVNYQWTEEDNDEDNVLVKQSNSRSTSSNVYWYESLVDVSERRAWRFAPTQLKRFSKGCRISVQYLHQRPMVAVYDPSWHTLSLFTVPSLLSGPPLVQLEVAPAKMFHVTENFLFSVGEDGDEAKVSVISTRLASIGDSKGPIHTDPQAAILQEIFLPPTRTQDGSSISQKLFGVLFPPKENYFFLWTPSTIYECHINEYLNEMIIDLLVNSQTRLCEHVVELVTPSEPIPPTWSRYSTLHVEDLYKLAGDKLFTAKRYDQALALYLRSSIDTFQLLHQMLRVGLTDAVMALLHRYISAFLFRDDDSGDLNQTHDDEKLNEASKLSFKQHAIVDEDLLKVLEDETLIHQINLPSSHLCQHPKCQALHSNHSQLSFPASVFMPRQYAPSPTASSFVSSSANLASPSPSPQSSHESNDLMHHPYFHDVLSSRLSTPDECRCGPPMAHSRKGTGRIQATELGSRDSKDRPTGNGDNLRDLAARREQILRKARLHKNKRRAATLLFRCYIQALHCGSENDTREHSHFFSLKQRQAQFGSVKEDMRMWSANSDQDIEDIDDMYSSSEDDDVLSSRSSSRSRRSSSPGDDQSGREESSNENADDHIDSNDADLDDEEQLSKHHRSSNVRLGRLRADSLELEKMKRYEEEAAEFLNENEFYAPIQSMVLLMKYFISKTGLDFLLRLAHARGKMQDCLELLALHGAHHLSTEDVGFLLNRGYGQLLLSSNVGGHIVRVLPPWQILEIILVEMPVIAVFSEGDNDPHQTVALLLALQKLIPRLETGGLFRLAQFIDPGLLSKGIIWSQHQPHCHREIIEVFILTVIRICQLKFQQYNKASDKDVEKETDSNIVIDNDDAVDIDEQDNEQLYLSNLPPVDADLTNGDQSAEQPSLRQETKTRPRIRSRANTVAIQEEDRKCLTEYDQTCLITTLGLYWDQYRLCSIIPACIDSGNWEAAAFAYESGQYWVDALQARLKGASARYSSYRAYSKAQQEKHEDEILNLIASHIGRIPNDMSKERAYMLSLIMAEWLKEKLNFDKLEQSLIDNMEHTADALALLLLSSPPSSISRSPFAPLSVASSCPYVSSTPPNDFSSNGENRSKQQTANHLRSSPLDLASLPAMFTARLSLALTSKRLAKILEKSAKTTYAAGSGLSSGRLAPINRLWFEILHNLNKDLSKRSIISFSSLHRASVSPSVTSLNSDVGTDFMFTSSHENSADKVTGRGSVSGSLSSPRCQFDGKAHELRNKDQLIAFTCGHVYEWFHFSKELLPTFHTKINDLNPTLPVSAVLMTQEYNHCRDGEIAMACPVCVYNSLVQEQHKIHLQIRTSLGLVPDSTSNSASFSDMIDSQPDVALGRKISQAIPLPKFWQ